MIHSQSFKWYSFSTSLPKPSVPNRPTGWGGFVSFSTGSQSPRSGCQLFDEVSIRFQPRAILDQPGSLCGLHLETSKSRCELLVLYRFEGLNTAWKCTRSRGHRRGSNAHSWESSGTCFKKVSRTVIRSRCSYFGSGALQSSQMACWRLSDPARAHTTTGLLVLT